MVGTPLDAFASSGFVHPTEMSRRIPVGGDDLLRGAAGDFGHAVELAGKAAGAGGGGAQFDDQFADLGFRHHGADAVPAGPSLACVETKDLAASPGQNGVDLGGRV